MDSINVLKNERWVRKLYNGCKYEPIDQLNEIAFFCSSSSA